MLETIIFFALPFAFTLLMACALTALVSALALFFKTRLVNQVMQHPYLKQQPWERLPIGIKASVMLDYFLRLSFPARRFWIIGHANRLLGHVDPAEVPVRLKWPLMGLWGGCFIGLAAMLLLWSLILLKMAG